MASSSPQILVVEDERDLADLYRTWLDGKFDVRVAYEGRGPWRT